MPVAPAEATLALSRRHAADAAAQADRLAQLMAEAFAVVDGLDDAAMERWVATAAPTARAADRAGYNLGSAFVGVLANVHAATVGAVEPADQLGDLAAYRERWQGPMIAARARAAEGAPYEDAKLAGAKRAKELGQSGYSTASRSGAHAAMKATGGITSYRRVPVGATCHYCLTIATRRYYVEDLAPAHANCDCGVMPVFDEEDVDSVVGAEARDALAALKEGDSALGAKLLAEGQAGLGTPAAVPFAGTWREGWREPPKGYVTDARMFREAEEAVTHNGRLIDGEVQRRLNAKLPDYLAGLPDSVGARSVKRESYMDVVHEVLGEVRPLASPAGASSAASLTSRSPTALASLRHYPADWVERSAARGRVKYADFAPGDKRGWHSGDRVHIPKSRARDLALHVHETGHHMEDTVDGVKPMEFAFWNRRTVADRTPVRPLRELVPHSGYAPNEVAAEDHFHNPYMGKVYGAAGPRSSWEVLTMGYEGLVGDKWGMRWVDDDYRQFIFGLLGTV